MKTWEMIKELTEKPDKEFISYAKKGDRDVLKTKSVNGAIRFSNEENRWHEVLIGVDLEREWKEVEQPLTFTEVLERVEEDTTYRFKVEFEELEGRGFPCNKYFCLDSLIKMLASNLFNSELARVLLEGKFYIKEGNYRSSKRAYRGYQES